MEFSDFGPCNQSTPQYSPVIETLLDDRPVSALLPVKPLHCLARRGRRRAGGGREAKCKGLSSLLRQGTWRFWSSCKNGSGIYDMWENCVGIVALPLRNSGLPCRLAGVPSGLRSCFDALLARMCIPLSFPGLNSHGAS